MTFVKGHQHSKETLEKLRLSLKGKKSWNTGLTKENDVRLNYERPASFKKGLSPWNKGTKGKQISWNKGKQTPEETRKKMRKPHFTARGENNINWKGGITPINQKIRECFEMRLWRKSVFERDNYTCVWCGLRAGNGKTVILNADHIKPFCDYPELRFAIDNGRTLCLECHKKTDNYCGRGLTRNKK